VWVLAFTCLALGIGLAASAWMVTYRDIQYVLPWLLQVALYATPVAYAVIAFPPELQPFLLANPLTWLMEAFRWSILGTAMPPAWQLAGALAVPALAFTLGAVVFQRNERTFADHI